MFKIHQASFRIILNDLEASLLNLEAQPAISKNDINQGPGDASSNSINSNSNSGSSQNSLSSSNSNSNSNRDGSSSSLPMVTDLNFFKSMRSTITVFWKEPVNYPRNLVITGYYIELVKFGNNSSRDVKTYHTMRNDKELRGFRVHVFQSQYVGCSPCFFLPEEDIPFSQPT